MDRRAELEGSEAEWIVGEALIRMCGTGRDGGVSQRGSVLGWVKILGLLVDGCPQADGMGRRREVHGENR